MKNENESVVHVKLEYDEAIQSKRDILTSEMNLLRVMNALKRYHSLRKEELRMKLIAQQKIKGLLTIIKDLKLILPKSTITRSAIREVEAKTRQKRKIPADNTIEEELFEISEKLKSIGG